MLRCVFVKLSSNRWAQAELERLIQRLQKYTGVGCGAGVLISGEEAVLKALLRRKLPKYCVFDGGANDGQFMGLISRVMAGQDVRVHAFEPSRAAFENLRGFKSPDFQIFLNSVGLGSVEGEATLYADKPGSQLGSLSKRNLDHFAITFDHEEKIKTTTVDVYCAENDITEIHLLKLDIEGAELGALEGARRMLDRRAIKCISFEFGGTNIDSRTYFRDLWKFLSLYKFNIFRVTPSGYLFPLKQYKEYYEQFRTTNFAAFLDGTLSA